MSTGLVARVLRCVCFSMLAAGATLVGSTARADGDDTLGPASIPIADGSYFLAAGVGLDGTQPGTINLTVPATASVRQVLLYWALFGTESDTQVTLNGSIPVTGLPIGVVNCQNLTPELTPRAFRADITSLGLIGTGANSITVDDLFPGPHPDSRADGAALFVIVEDGPLLQTLIVDGADFAFRQQASNPCRRTERQTFTFPALATRRAAEVILLVGDQEVPTNGDLRPEAIEVEIDMGPSLELIDVLVGADGPRWDTLRIPIDIPAGSTSVSVQIFSEDRAGLGNRPASLLWVTGGLTFVESAECAFKFRLPNASVRSGECVRVPVLLDSTCPIQGFTTAISHDEALFELRDITINNTASADFGAEFFSFEIVNGGGTAGVILDLEAPFGNQMIPAGEGRPIVAYQYCCRPLAAGAAAVSSPLRFAEDVLGSPVKSNIVVVDGRSITPVLCPGSIRCEPPAPPPPSETYFICGGPELDAEGDPLPLAPAAVGETRELCFYYCSPEDNAVGHGQLDHIQGLTMALCFDCNLEVDETTFRVPDDSILNALGSEFVSVQVDSDPNDGDGCEIIIGILVDALPPFEGQTLPPTATPLKLACIDVTPGPNALCGSTLDIRFCDGINGTGRVPLKNLYAAENHSFQPALFDCALDVVGPPRFFRADCNSNGMVEISDAAAVVSALFQMGSWTFYPRCTDACDCNDDGRMDLADTVCILSFLFLQGAFPPAPGPGFDMSGAPTPAGIDPTADKIGCDLRTCP